MGLTSALNTSLNGLVLNETTIDVLGNNIANSGTNGFKASTVLFTTQLSRTLSVGSRPTNNLGGTNPRQIGLGATTAAIQKDFTQGSITNSTSPSDLAIQGDGFFVLDGGEGNVYSRNGNFSLNNQNKLINNQGLRVQGYGVDANFDLVTTQLTDISIPLGELNIAERTQNVIMSGALMPTGTPGTRGSLIESQPLFDQGNLVGGLNSAVSGTTLLTDVRDSATSTTPVFTTGQVLTFTPRKGGRTLETNTVTIGPGADQIDTLAELAAFMDGTLGLHSGGAIPEDETGVPGVTVAPGVSVSNGRLQIVGNRGTVNDLSVAVGDLIQGTTAVPVAFTKVHESDGEATITDFVVYDSLGAQINVKMTAVMEDVSPTRTTFRWFIDSHDDSRTDVAITSGTIVFDAVGNVIEGGIGQVALDRSATAAISPMQITVDFRNLAGVSSESSGSAISMASQDGSDPGTLVNFVIDETGVINGVFDNGIIRTLGQVTLARFSNPQGLIEAGGLTFSEGVSSGPPFLTTPGNFGAGTLRSGAIELSNTDIGRNLVDLIVASTNYRGNARVISSVQQLVDELLVLGR